MKDNFTYILIIVGAVVILFIYKVLRICMLLDDTPSKSSRKRFYTPAKNKREPAKIKRGHLYYTVYDELVKVVKHDKETNIWVCKLSANRNKFVYSGVVINCFKEELRLLK